MARTKQRGQAILDIALCLAVAFAAIGSMAIYLRRGLQAKYRAVVLQCAKDSGVVPHQYEPYYTREAYTVEDKEGVIEVGKGTRSVTRMETDENGWQHTPLPWSSQ